MYTLPGAPNPGPKPAKPTRLLGLMYDKSKMPEWEQKHTAWQKKYREWKNYWDRRYAEDREVLDNIKPHPRFDYVSVPTDWTQFRIDVEKDWRQHQMHKYEDKVKFLQMKEERSKSPPIPSSTTSPLTPSTSPLTPSASWDQYQHNNKLMIISAYDGKEYLVHFKDLKYFTEGAYGITFTGSVVDSDGKERNMLLKIGFVENVNDFEQEVFLQSLAANRKVAPELLGAILIRLKPNRDLPFYVMLNSLLTPTKQHDFSAKKNRGGQIMTVVLMRHLQNAAPLSEFDTSNSELNKYVCGAIKNLHNIGIIHRDLHSKNIMYLPTEKKVYIIDYGRSSLVTDEHLSSKEKTSNAYKGISDRIGIYKNTGGSIGNESPIKYLRCSGGNPDDYWMCESASGGGQYDTYRKCLNHKMAPAIKPNVSKHV